jgi:hypothetical protein
VDHFDDDAGSAHEGNINKAAEAGLARGTGTRTYSPDGLVIRGQMASFLANALGLLVADGHVPPRTAAASASAVSASGATDTDAQPAPAPGGAPAFSNYLDLVQARLLGVEATVDETDDDAAQAAMIIGGTSIWDYIHVMPVYASYMGTFCEADSNRVQVNIYSGNQGSYNVRLWLSRWNGTNAWGPWYLAHEGQGSSNVTYVGPGPHAIYPPDGYYLGWIQIWYPGGPVVANHQIGSFNNRWWSTLIWGWVNDNQYSCRI